MVGAGGRRTDSEEPEPDDPSDFTGKDLEGRRLTLRLEGEEGSAKSLELWFGEGNRFEQIESGGEQAATRSRGRRLPIGQPTPMRTRGPRMGTADSGPTTTGPPAKLVTDLHRVGIGHLRL